MKPTEQSPRLAGAILDRYRHVCAFFRAPEEAHRILLPFVKEGLARGEKVFQVVDPRRRTEHIRRLSEAGIEVAGLEETGQLEVRGWDDAYLRGGRFDQDAMLPLWEELLGGAKRSGFPLTRVTGPTDWAFGSPSDIEALIEYEARVNDISEQRPDPLVCLYDPAKFGAEVVLDILRTHPIVIIGGVLQENPFYLPPDVFLRELRNRRTAARTA